MNTSQATRSASPAARTSSPEADSIGPPVNAAVPEASSADFGDVSLTGSEADREVLINRAYREYCRLLVAGQAPKVREFCARYPGIQSSLQRLVFTHELTDEIPELAPGEPIIKWPRAGESFLGFALERELGRGGFARVFLASEPALGNRRVVVKISWRGGAEAQKLGRLQHPHIVPVYSIQENAAATKLTAVCMPYLGSATLHNLLDRAFAGPKLPASAQVILEAANPGGICSTPEASQDTIPQQRTYEEAILRIVLQLAQALAYVHAQGLSHGDLKPSNVLLSADGNPLLLDFNLSFEGPLQNLVFAGTYPYMSPEQLRQLDREDGKEPAPVDTRSDLFSLGVLAYELLTGKNPFGPVPSKEEFPKKRTAWIERQRRGPVPVRSLNARVSRGVAAIVESCLAFRPKDRPNTAAELVQLLRKFLPRYPRLAAWTARRRQALVVVAAACLTTVAGAALTFAYREPYSVRALRQGRQAYEQKDYHQAVAILTQSLEADPSPSAYLARARAYQQLGCALARDIQASQDPAGLAALEGQKREKFVQALQDYDNADPERQNGSIVACRGFCLSQQRNHGDAIWFYTEAIKQGLATAAVFNNRGFGFLQICQWEKANDDFKQAIRLDPTLQTAFYNRAQLCLIRALALRLAAPAAPRFELTTIVEDGLQSVQTAIRLGRVPAELYRDAALLCLAAPDAQDRRVDLALAYLRQAVEHGFDPREFKDPLFDCLQAKSAYQTLLKEPVPEKEPIQAIRLIDPLEESTSP